jgi:hypothetical protein
MRQGSAHTEVGFRFTLNRDLCANQFLVSYEVFKMASEADLKPMRVHESTIGLRNTLLLPCIPFFDRRK